MLIPGGALVNKSVILAPRPGKIGLMALDQIRPEWNNPVRSGDGQMALPVNREPGRHTIFSSQPRGTGEMDWVDDRAFPGRAGRPQGDGCRPRAKTPVESGRAR